MPSCSFCAAACDDSARFCPSCGRLLGASPADVDDVTFEPSAAAAARASSSPEAAKRADTPRRSPATVAPTPHGPLQPGAVLAGRYRIVALLGRGGMGEVYRADDLTLGQPVALKFLPIGLQRDGERLARFRSEVSIARQVSHPNVCRVYDIGDIEGATFLSMEYIDGEDLASLLRRIGRLPVDKGLEIARQICAGLGAAHERGVVHKDLKPANVMIDGRGHARIADFGLAAAGDASIAEIAGTPAYMSPEQFEGEPATVRSDIYALGLVLYEIFTGKRAFSGSTVREFAELHRGRTPSSMTALVSDLDPAIERAIERCLEKDPSARPPTALAVAASLPGGDPLAAAMARGETPAPEIVAAAGSVGLVKPLHAIAACTFAVACLVTIVVLSGSIHPARVTALPKSPDVLRDRSQQIVTALGYADPPADYSSGFVASAFLQHTASEPWWQRAADLRAGRPAGILFWYRQSPYTLEPAGFSTRVADDDPPQTVPGMIGLKLDPLGRLHSLLVGPQRADQHANDAALHSPNDAVRADTPAADWSVPFREADLDMSRFVPTAPRWRPPVYADARAAWDGKYPNRPDIPIHVEAASTGGRIVYFDVFNPWNQSAEPAARPTPAAWFLNVFMPVLLLGMLVAGVVLAVRNLRLGRGDRRGAFRIAGALFLAGLCGSVVGADVKPQLSAPFGLLLSGSAPALLIAALAWVAYVGLEPYVRRRWPYLLISWTRLLSGRWRDPLVGRDVLAGVTLGAASCCVVYVSQFFTSAQLRGGQPVWLLDGFRFSLVLLCNHASRGILGGLGFLLLLFCLTLLVRRRWIAAGIVILLQAANVVAISGSPVAGGLLGLMGGAYVMFAVLRYGLLALVMLVFTSNVANDALLTFDLTQWYAPASLVVVAVLAGLALFGARTSANLRAMVPRLLGD